MVDIQKLVDSLNLPKRIIDGAEDFLKALLGEAVKETGGMIADQIRFRRFRNQIIIFSKAKELVAISGISPKQINLKTLCPLIEYSSLEEEEPIQNIWANLIANISTQNTEQFLDLKCIAILKEITPNEVLLLNHCFEIFKVEEEKTLERWKQQKSFVDRKSVFTDNAIFATWDYKEILNMDQDQLDLYTDRLISFGLMKYEQPNLREYKSSEKISDIFSGTHTSLEMKSYELETSERIIFTTFGLYFVKICKYNNPLTK
jgi:hypothetical protein